MLELQMIWAWTTAHIDALRHDEDGNRTADGGFTTLEWVALAGVVITAAVIVATVLMNKARTGANNVNVQ